MDKWTTTKSESLVDNHWVKIRKDSVVLPNKQKIDDFYVITINNAAAIVAIDEDGNCILKKEYRYCYDRDLIEVPAGTFEEDETDGLAVAKRELLEETGYESDEWQYLGATVESSAKLTNYMHIYFANHCKKVSEQHLDATEDVEVIVVPFEKAIEMVMNSEGIDGLPKSDVLKFFLEDNCSIVVRPSGTEPKLKAYISVSATTKEEAQVVEGKLARAVEEKM